MDVYYQIPIVRKTYPMETEMMQRRFIGLQKNALNFSVIRLKRTVVIANVCRVLRMTFE